MAKNPVVDGTVSDEETTSTAVDKKMLAIKIAATIVVIGAVATASHLIKNSYNNRNSATIEA